MTDIWPIAVEIMEDIASSCNSMHIERQIGVLRGLLWAHTGEDPGNPDNPAEILKYFPGRYHIIGDQFFDNDKYENGKLKEGMEE